MYAKCIDDKRFNFRDKFVSNFLIPFQIQLRYNKIILGFIWPMLQSLFACTRDSHSHVSTCKREGSGLSNTREVYNV